jgi:hypothetical protein
VSRELRPCGTIAAYRRHQRAYERPCDACREEYNRVRPSRAASGGGSEHRQQDLYPCGTTAAYNRHIRHREEPCRSCRQARHRYDQDRRERARETAEIMEDLETMLAIAEGTEDRSLAEADDGSWYRRRA